MSKPNQPDPTPEEHWHSIAAQSQPIDRIGFCLELQNEPQQNPNEPRTWLKTTAGGSTAVSKRKFEELTQDEIDARAAAIRAEWPEHRWRKEEPGEPPVDLPVIKLDKRRNGVVM